MSLVTAVGASGMTTVQGRVRQLVERLESLAVEHDARSTSRRSSASSSNSLSTNTSGSNYSENSPNASGQSAAPRLRRMHGRLVVSPEDYENLPQALPTVNFYQRFPRAVGPLANVVVSSPAEYQMLRQTCDAVEVVASVRHRDVARHRLCQEDIDAGGFFVYQPKGRRSQYFKLRDVTSPSDAYGTATYIQV